VWYGKRGSPAFLSGHFSSAAHAKGHTHLSLRGFFFLVADCAKGQQRKRLGWDRGLGISSPRAGVDTRYIRLVLGMAT
jgi:hypothetical protein